MIYECKDCGASVEIPSDALQDEILSCIDCGLDYVIDVDPSGVIQLKELAIEGEDWGE
jgi:alpha-aminoadipate carrier protein LysW